VKEPVWIDELDALALLDRLIDAGNLDEAGYGAFLRGNAKRSEKR